MFSYFKNFSKFLLVVGILALVVFVLWFLWETWSLFVFLFFVIYLFSFFTMFHLLISERNANTKISWLFFIFLLPLLGALFYIVFGQKYKHRTSMKGYYERYKDFFASQQKNQFDKIDNEKYLELIETSKLLDRPIVDCNMQLLIGGDEKFRELFKEMRKATKFLHIIYYILKPGEIFREFESILIEKSKQGVDVRIIVDDFGIWAMPSRDMKNLIDAGIQIYYFGKVHFPFLSSNNGYRFHRKIVIIDGQVVFTGGLNISDEYAHFSKKYGYWADVHTKLTGNIAQQYSLLFLQDWFINTKEKLNINTYAPSVKSIKTNNKAVMVESGPDNWEAMSHKMLVKWIYSAKKSIKLTTPYFIPTPEVLLALKTASMAGVNVEILVPSKPDKKIVLMTTKFYAKILMKYGVKFIQLSHILVHSKFGIFDEKFAYIGTMNIDRRSFFAQFEVQTLICGNGTKKLVNLFNYYKSKSTVMILPKDNKFVFIWKTFFIRIFSQLM